jgi:SOS-response transcriptional repressor LexA
MPGRLLKEDTDRVYEFVRSYIKERRVAPSHREIAEGCYMSRSSVQRHLDLLAAYGKVVREVGLARGLWLPDENEDENNGRRQP